MSGYNLVCKKRANGEKCNMTISADSKEELLRIAVQHMDSVHGLKECMALKDKLRAGMRKSRHAA